MTIDELSGYIDLSLLRPDATIREIEDLIREAQRYTFASVWTPPRHVGLAARMLGESPVKVGTVVGFPFGYQSTDAKVRDACNSIDAGAGEVDMVMNISMFKSRKIAFVQDEISSIVSTLSGVTVKVIIETCYLTDKEKTRACELVINGKAGFVKTSTGVGPGGATAEDVRAIGRGACRGRG